jgi:hypothetical protein
VDSKALVAEAARVVPEARRAAVEAAGAGSNRYLGESGLAG